MGLNYFQRDNVLTQQLTPDVPELLEDQLGVGLAIPFQFISNQWVSRGGASKVAQDIFVTLCTPVGRRLWQPDFGSELPYLIFQPYQPTLLQELYQATLVSLNTWVPAITVQNVIIDPSNIQNGALTLIVQYLLNGTSASQSVSIILQMNDQIQIPANALTIGGVPLFPGA